MNPNNREDIMKHWDSWRKYISEGGSASWPRDAFESLLDYFEELILPNSMSRFEYDDLLEKTKWYFETDEAMQTARRLAKRGRITMGAYKGLAIMAGEAESDLRKLIK